MATENLVISAMLFKSDKHGDQWNIFKSAKLLKPVFVSPAHDVSLYYLTRTNYCDWKTL